MTSDEFYIGYRKKAPAGVARLMRFATIGLALGLAFFAALAAYVQKPIDQGTYEFGIVKEFEGILRDEPIPHLVLTTDAGEFSPGAAMILVSVGKFGFPEFATEGIGRRVRFSGSLIYRDTTAIIEMTGADAFEILGAAPAIDTETASFGEVLLEGELVDTKCYLGVMRPGAGKVHRACASNCLRGGIQPGLLVRTANDFDTVVMLSDPEGGTLTVDYQWAARNVSARGELHRLDGLLVLDTVSLELSR